MRNKFYDRVSLHTTVQRLCGRGGLVSAFPEDECGDPRVSRGRGQSTLPACPPLRRAGGRQRHRQTGAEDRGRRVWAWSQTGTRRRRRRTGDSAGRGAERRRTPSRMHVHVRPRLRPGRREAGAHEDTITSAACSVAPSALPSPPTLACQGAGPDADSHSSTGSRSAQRRLGLSGGQRIPAGPPRAAR